MKSAMNDFFDRLIAVHAAAGAEPRVSRNPDAGPSIYHGAPDAYDSIAWRPMEKSARHDLAALAPDLGPLHPSLDEYFNSYWFASLEGRIGRWAISLYPVLPDLELDKFLRMARGYAQAHGGRLEHVPIGVEVNGLQVVVDNRTGAVAIEDWERGTFTEIAPSLNELLLRLQP